MPIVAIPVLELLHVPPVVASVKGSGAVFPAHVVVFPPIAGKVEMVTTVLPDIAVVPKGVVSLTRVYAVFDVSAPVVNVACP